MNFPMLRSHLSRQDKYRDNKKLIAVERTHLAQWIVSAGYN